MPMRNCQRLFKVARYLTFLLILNLCILTILYFLFLDPKAGMKPVLTTDVFIMDRFIAAIVLGIFSFFFTFFYSNCNE